MPERADFLSETHSLSFAADLKSKVKPGMKLYAGHSVIGREALSVSSQNCAVPIWNIEWKVNTAQTSISTLLAPCFRSEVKFSTW